MSVKQSSPPRPSSQVVAIIGVFCLAFLVYAVLAIGNPLIGLFPVFAAIVFYFWWRFLLAFESIADSLQRLATEREREER